MMSNTMQCRCSGRRSGVPQSGCLLQAGLGGLDIRSQSNLQICVSQQIGTKASIGDGMHVNPHLGVTASWVVFFQWDTNLGT